MWQLLPEGLQIIQCVGQLPFLAEFKATVPNFQHLSPAGAPPHSHRNIENADLSEGPVGVQSDRKANMFF